MKKIILLFFLVISGNLFSQNITTTKVLRNVYLSEKPNVISRTTCSIKKNKEIEVVSFSGNDYFEVIYKECKGYLNAIDIAMTKPMMKMKENYYLELQDLANKMRLEKELKERKDSIIKAINKRKKDSLEKIERFKLDSLRANIVSYARSKQLKANFSNITSIKDSPNLMGKVIFKLDSITPLTILNYEKDYYKIEFNNKMGYAHRIFLASNSDSTKKLLESLKEIRDSEEEERQEEERIAEEKVIEMKLRKKYGNSVYEKLRRGYYWLGMTKEMAKVSLGNPSSINRSVGSWGVHEQWVYRSRDINLYFENGKLRSYQD